MKNYNAMLQRHLANYARTRLGVHEQGVFKGKNYPHILPPRLKFLNFIEPVRAELQDYLAKNPGIKLHQYFHHLNSSQAFAFNFFFPYFSANTQSAKIISNTLGITSEAIKESWKFEYIPDKNEGTNVDFAWQLLNGGTVFCEVKLSENEFGTAVNDQRHRKKLEEIYRPALKGLITESMLVENLFFDHYQLLRNVALLKQNLKNQLIILLPKENSSLDPHTHNPKSQLSKVLCSALPLIRPRIHIAYIEDVIGTLKTINGLTPELRLYANCLEEKYVLGRL